MTHEELLVTPEYWTTKMQIELYQKVEQYLNDNDLTRTDFAKKLNVSKGYVSQILNGNFDHRMSKYTELALLVGYYPKISLEPIESNLEIDDIINVTHNKLDKIGYCALIYPKKEKTFTDKNESIEDVPNYKIIA